MIIFALCCVFLFCATLSLGAILHSVFSSSPFKAPGAHSILFGHLELLVNTSDIGLANGLSFDTSNICAMLHHLYCCHLSGNN